MEAKQMSVTVKLSEISVGKSSGETESEIEFFKDMFYKDNLKFENINDFSNFVICGRKGTGKSLLALYYKDQKEIEKNNTFVKHLKMKILNARQETIDLGLNPEIEYRILFQEYFIFKQFISAVEKINDKFPSCYFGDRPVFGFNAVKMKRFRKAKINC